MNGPLVFVNMNDYIVFISSMHYLVKLTECWFLSCRIWLLGPHDFCVGLYLLFCLLFFFFSSCGHVKKKKKKIIITAILIQKKKNRNLCSLPWQEDIRSWGSSWNCKSAFLITSEVARNQYKQHCFYICMDTRLEHRSVCCFESNWCYIFHF